MSNFNKIAFIFIFTALSSLFPDISFGEQREDFVGAWINSDPNTSGITRILITASGGNDLAVHAYGKCLPTDCDWGTEVVSYTGNPVEVMYDKDYVQITLTLQLTGPDSIYVTAFYDYGPEDPRPNFTSYYTFEPVTEPDLILDEISVSSPILPYGQYSWIGFNVRNIGAAGVSGPLRARIINRERNGVPIATSGYMDISYSSPISIDEVVYHQFAVGNTGSSWTDGDYTFNIEIDYDDMVSEFSETNNESNKVLFTIMDEYQLRGRCEFNGINMFWLANDVGVQADIFTDELLPEAQFRYYPVTNRYALNNVPDLVPFNLHVALEKSEINRYYPGNYLYVGSINLSTMTEEEKENYDLDFFELIHMTSPWDNTLPYTPGYYEVYEGIVIEWEPVTYAQDYQIIIDRFRDSGHPSGYGFIENVTNAYTTETSFTPYLPVSNADEHYEVKIYALNSSFETIGKLYKYSEGSFGFDHRFKIAYDCYSFGELKLYLEEVSPFSSGEDNWFTYHLRITNTDIIPEDMFASAPDLPACGLNEEASRTYMHIYDQNDTLLTTYCGIESPDELEAFAFNINAANPQPEMLKIELEDRRCYSLHESVWVDTYYACPIGDLNADCVVDLADLMLMAPDWLADSPAP